MLAAGIKDVVNCGYGFHMVPRSEMTKTLSDNGKSWKNICVACKEKRLALRAKAKK